ncbi:N-acetylglutamate synthase [Coniochaeta ligniaria NRRL 30616]|uniref:Amino-acid acetyltransferase, mitochondrial n=1 Tax=Coniochaeta ligniaria NRRL 30616 TaxID=1408157 RepID=A0A1J7JGB2_9PEZI|nr:N-acetylglutamate synthase [Coniochaeta ligniaria NRRL 30616]
MIPRSAALKRAGSTAQISVGRTSSRLKHQSAPGRPGLPSHERVDAFRCPYTSNAAAEKQKRDKDREFFISVLESSATKRDAKAYLQTFGSSGGVTKPNAASVLQDSFTSVSKTPRFIQPSEKGGVVEVLPEVDEAPHVAIVKFRKPQLWDDDILAGVTKTLTQLRTLGLYSVIVVDCDLDDAGSRSWRKVTTHQVDRIARAIGQHGTPGAKVVDSSLSVNAGSEAPTSPFTSSRLYVEFEAALTSPLRSGYMVIVPCAAQSQELGYVPADSNEVVLTLAKFLSGLQIPREAVEQTPEDSTAIQPPRKATVDRIIVVDPIGGIPARDRPKGAHVFINMEDEYDTAKAGLDLVSDNVLEATKQKHLENLKLAKDCLAILPSTASAVITTPAEAANLNPSHPDTTADLTDLVGAVGTRRKQNPLIHNLLTDRPIYSSSLPLGRIKQQPQPQPTSSGNDAHLTTTRGIPPVMSTTTLAKRGLPVTIYPDPRHSGGGPWQPPRPGSPRLRLTDTCVDLPRLIHLIDDSFGRALDAEHYLARVSDSLAGIIIAGEYEGGAILTWERPAGLDEETAYAQGRMVPYLDKFAVLKRSQGAGGVADVVFNAMVRDCFPDGVCWRSRRDNPVNKWYFERSRGSWKLLDSNWAMFWTTPGAALEGGRIRDYESVCRNVVPSWLDKGKAAD